ncbi:MAG: hypothetical protein JXB47_13655 [Anaerolineae bacterium]|nr:hypothetical protein [Anaerolineae bacterium]
MPNVDEWTEMVIEARKRIAERLRNAEALRDFGDFFYKNSAVAGDYLEALIDAGDVNALVGDSGLTLNQVMLMINFTDDDRAFLDSGYTLPGSTPRVSIQVGDRRATLQQVRATR